MNFEDEVLEGVGCSAVPLSLHGVNVLTIGSLSPYFPALVCENSKAFILQNF